MTTSFEGIFGEQLEFPIGNRDADIDSALEEVKESMGNKFNADNLGDIYFNVTMRLQKKYGIDHLALIPHPSGGPEDDKEVARTMSFFDTYDHDYVENRIKSSLA